tara:strand:+ start:293 stop:562 length:270 start_codon:yes stop_codon:yes gene_type:complete
MSEFSRISERTWLPCILIGNKSDLEDCREVPYQEGADMAKKMGCQFQEISAKTAEGPIAVIEAATRLAMRKIEDQEHNLKSGRSCCAIL